MTLTHSPDCDMDNYCTCGVAEKIDDRYGVIERVARAYPPHDAYPLDEILAEEPERFLLVEQSVITGEYSLSAHESLDALAEYQTTQEYAEDWAIIEAVDLDTGQVYRAASVTIRWEEQEVRYLPAS